MREYHVRICERLRGRFLGLLDFVVRTDKSTYRRIYGKSHKISGARAKVESEPQEE